MSDYRDVTALLAWLDEIAPTAAFTRVSPDSGRSPASPGHVTTVWTWGDDESSVTWSKATEDRYGRLWECGDGGRYTDLEVLQRGPVFGHDPADGE